MAAQDQQRRMLLVEALLLVKLKADLGCIFHFPTSNDCDYAVGPTLVFLFFFLLPMTVTVQVVFFYFFCSFPLLQSPLATENVWFCVDLQPRYGCSRPKAPYAVGGSATAA